MQLIFVFNEMIDRFPRLKAILADGGYRGVDASNAAKKHGWELKVVLNARRMPEEIHSPAKALDCREDFLLA